MLLVSGFVRWPTALCPVEWRRALGGGWAVAPAVFGCGSGGAAAPFGCPTRFDATRVVGRGCRWRRTWLFGPASRARLSSALSESGSYVRSQNAAAYWPRGALRSLESARQVKPAIPATANLGDSICVAGFASLFPPPTRNRSIDSCVHAFEKDINSTLAKQRRATLSR